MRRRRVADTITLPDGQTYSREEFTATLEQMLLDLNLNPEVEDERKALADILATELMALEGYGPDLLEELLQ